MDDIYVMPFTEENQFKRGKVESCSHWLESKILRLRFQIDDAIMMT